MHQSHQRKKKSRQEKLPYFLHEVSFCSSVVVHEAQLPQGQTFAVTHRRCVSFDLEELCQSSSQYESKPTPCLEADSKPVNMGKPNPELQR